MPTNCSYIGVTSLRAVFLENSLDYNSPAFQTLLEHRRRKIRYISSPSLNVGVLWEACWSMACQCSISDEWLLLSNVRIYFGCKALCNIQAVSGCWKILQVFFTFLYKHLMPFVYLMTWLTVLQEEVSGWFITAKWNLRVWYIFGF